MQKTLAFLEQNVQWFALTLGGIFVLYCAWAYVLTPPATVKVPGQRDPLYPGNVSEFTNKLVREEQRKMKDNGFTTIVVADIVDPWRKQMGAPAAGVPGFPTYVFNSFPSNETLVGEGPGTPLAQFQVDKLPELPKAQPQTPQTGLSVIPLSQPGGGNQAAQPVALQDQLWVTIPFVVPAQQLKDAFDKILNGKRPDSPQLFSTDILQVDLQRQRAIGVDANNQPVFPNGEEGVENVPMPQIQKNDLQPIPDNAAPDGVKATFVDTASHNMALITQPKFYETKGGDPFPTPDALGVASGAGTANPGAPVPPLGRPLPPPMLLNPNAAPGQPANASSHIDPLTLTKDISGWAIDETVKPGQTYRYRFLYHMKNPVAMEQNIAAPAIVNILDVKSAAGDWSAPVRVKDKTEFFLMAVRPKGDVQMDVFHWEKGNWKLDKQTPLSPGDLVPGTDWVVVDVHSSGSDRRDRYVLLTDDAGNVHRHYPSERDSPRHKELQELANPPAAAGAAAGPARPPPARFDQAARDPVRLATTAPAANPFPPLICLVLLGNETGHRMSPTTTDGTQASSSQTQGRRVHVRIRRQDAPARPHRWEEFSVPYRPNLNVISCLQWIAAHPTTVQGGQTTPPVWDSGCLEEVCGACTMRINGRTRQACSALVDKLGPPDEPIVLEPMTKFPLVRDLFVDRQRLFNDLKRVKAWVPIDGTYDLGRGPVIDRELNEERYPLSRCISCGCCLEACPQYTPVNKFVGAAVISQTRLFNDHPVGATLKEERLEVLMDEGGVADCGKAGNCVRVCPKEIPLLESIAVVQRQATVYSIKKFFSH